MPIVKGICPQCGAKLDVNDAEDVQYCGANLTANQRFCTNCGRGNE